MFRTTRMRAAARRRMGTTTRLRLRYLEGRCVPATITVTGTGDTVAVDSIVTLREAINSINGGADINADVVAVGAYGTNDTVLFDASFSGASTIGMSGQFGVAKSMTITGKGSGLLTVNSTAASGTTSRIFNVTGGTLSLSGMTLSGGNATSNGGAINFSAQTVNLTDVVVTGNQSSAEGGGINFSTGTLNITNSSVSSNQATGSFSNGGGINISSSGILNLTDSTVAGNSSGEDGGGIYFFSGGTFNMTRSTLSGNQSGLVSSGSGGGGVYLFNTTTVITNSTISGNTTANDGGGIGNFAGSSLKVFNSTIAFNTAGEYGGGIANGSTLNSTIVSNNTDVGVGPDTNGTVTAYYSLIGSSIGATISGSGNVTDIDPLLDTLGTPVGGTTAYHNLKTGSPAINAGSNVNGLITDQRGGLNPRVQGKSADIGSIETPDPAPSASGSSPNVNTAGGTSQSVTMTFADFVGSKLIDRSKLNTGDITVSGPGGFSATPTLVTPTTPDVDAQSIVAVYTFTPPGGTWDSADNGSYTISVAGNEVYDKDTPTPNSVGAGAVGTFKVSLGKALVVNAANDEATDTDGKISLREAILEANLDATTSDTITFDNVVFSSLQTIDISALGEIAITGPVSISGTAANKVEVSGGGISRVFVINDATTATINVSISSLAIINGLPATGNGGGVQIGNESVTFDSVAVRANSSPAAGGGIGFNASGGAITLLNSEISGNTAASTGGGGVYVTGTNQVLIRNSTFSSNVVTAGIGGGFCGFSWGTLGSFTMTNSTFTLNTASGDGGAIRVTSGGAPLNIESSVISGNTGSVFAPEIYAGVVNMTSSLVGSTSGFTLGTDSGNVVPGTDPVLGLLANNGGPTQTHLPGPGSPLRDAGSNPASLTTDQRGAGFPRTLTGTTDIGAVESVTAVPTAKLTPFGPIVTAGPTPDTVEVTYNDTVAIDVGTIDKNDITITGPAGTLNVLSVTVDINTNGTPRVATYKFAVPGGAWDGLDSGTYSVAMVGNQVADTDGPNFVPAGNLGTFKVAIAGKFVVNATNDETTDTDGKMSLREALALVNSAADTNDTVTFDPAVFAAAQTIDISALGEMKIASPVTITGPTAIVTLDAKGASRVLNVDVPTTTANPISISNMAITGGSAAVDNGGGILNTDEALTLTKVTVSGNTTANEGGGVGVKSGTGSLTLINCTVSGNSATGSFSNGGGVDIRSNSNVTILESTISNNSAGEDGGGIYFFSGGTLTMDNSTVSGNQANLVTGSAGGGGFYLFSTTATIRNSTISGNSAKGSGGGIGVFSTNLLTVKNSTIAFNSTTGNGGGIGGSAGSTIVSTIVAKNSATGTGPDVNGAVNADFSLLSNSAGATITGANNVLDVDPLLASLANYGGPTLTHGLAAGSPALNAGSNPDGLANDQRGTGFPRVVGPSADIGSFEGFLTSPAAAFTPVSPIVTPGPTPNTVNVVYSDDIGIDVSTIGTGDITITGPGGPLAVTGASFSPAGNGTPRTATYTFTLPGGAWDGTDNGTYTVAMNAGQVFDTDGPNSVPAGPLGNFKVAIPITYLVDEATDVDDLDYSPGKLSIREAILLANGDGAPSVINFKASAFPGGTTVSLNSGEMKISQPVDINGPGRANLKLDGLTTSRAFSIDVAASTLNPIGIADLTIANGTVTGGNGGGIDMVDEALTLIRVTITGCSADSGGGINLSSGTGSITLIDSTVSTNSALVDDGGGIHLSGGSPALKLVRSTVSGNTAAEDGGGIYFFSGGSLDMDSSTVSGNTATGDDGGGIYFWFVTAKIVNSTISGNSAGDGGGGMVNFSSTNVTVNNSTVANNTSVGLGGGIWASSGTLTLNSTIVAGSIGGYDVEGNVNADFSLLGNSLGAIITGASNVLDTDPMLDVLANYGGPTETHALKTGSPAIDVGANTLALAGDQRGFSRVVGVAADIGSYEFGATPAKAPTVVASVVNGGGNQRSIVTSIKVTFSEAVTFPSGINAAFQLNRLSPGLPTGLVNTSAVQSGSDVTITFATGGAVNVDSGNSLRDGLYQLTIVAANVLGAGGQLDGDGNGTGGDNFLTSTTGDATNSNVITRLFGDVNGDRDVDAADFGAFRGAFQPVNNLTFDFDADGDVDAQDFGAFRGRFGSSV